jgi:hypothetical protein
MLEACRTLAWMLKENNFKWVRCKDTFPCRYTILNIVISVRIGSGIVRVVGIATGYGLDGPGIECRWGRDFPHLSRPALGSTQPPVQWVPGFSNGQKAHMYICIMYVCTFFRHYSILFAYPYMPCFIPLGARVNQAGKNWYGEKSVFSVTYDLRTKKQLTI